MEYGGNAWKWCADALTAVARGEVSSCVVESSGVKKCATVTIIRPKGDDESRDSWVTDKPTALEMASKINQALALRGKMEVGAPEDVAPAHSLKWRKVKEHFHAGEMHVHLTRKEDHYTAGEVLQWEAACDENGDPADWYVPRDLGGSIRYAVMKWKIRKWNNRNPMEGLEEYLAWRTFFLREDHFRDLILTGEVIEIIRVLVQRFGPLSEYEVTPCRMESG